MPIADVRSSLTPCVKLCTLDASGELCLGCGRSVAEITGWSRMDDAARQRVMTRLDAARAAPDRR